MSAYVSIPVELLVCIRLHLRYDALCVCEKGEVPPAAYVSIRQHTSAYVSIRQHTSAHVSTRQHTSAKKKEEPPGVFEAQVTWAGSRKAQPLW
jgi:hypothetical protein